MTFSHLARFVSLKGLRAPGDTMGNHNKFYKLSCKGQKGIILQVLHVSDKVSLKLES